MLFFYHFQNFLGVHSFKWIFIFKPHSFIFITFKIDSNPTKDRVVCSLSQKYRSNIHTLDNSLLFDAFALSPRIVLSTRSFFYAWANLFWISKVPIDKKNNPFVCSNSSTNSPKKMIDTFSMLISFLYSHRSSEIGRWVSGNESWQELTKCRFPFGFQIHRRD